MERYQEIEKSIIKKYRKEIWKRFIDGVNTYQMIQEGDKIAVCISGGKDSMLLAKCMQELQKHGKIKFDLVFLCMDPGYNPVNRAKIEENAKILNIPLHIFSTTIFSSVENIEDSPCYLCARMRRGYLYKEAQKLGCNKIALGHHFDDIIETIVMGMFYGAQIQTMMPKLHSTNHKGMQLIRPLYMVKEKDIIRWAKGNELSFIACACRFTEKSAEKEDLSKRREVKKLIASLCEKNEYVDMNIFRSVQNVNLSTIISYKDKEGVHHFLDTYDKEEYHDR